MITVSEDPKEPQISYDDDINLLDLILILARRWRLIACMTVLAAIISAGIAMNMPKVYASNAKLILLEFGDRTEIIRVSNDGRQVLRKSKGIWQATDVSVMKGVLESSQLKQAVGSKLDGGQYTVQVKQEKQLGVITVKVEGSNREATVKIATATTEEAARLAFRMGLLASPAVVLDDVLPQNLDAATMVVRLLEQPTVGVQVKPKISLIILLSTVTGFFCSVLLAYVLDYLRKLER